MPPKRTTTPMSDAAIKALVARSVADALAEHEANRSRNGDDNHDSGTSSRRTERAAREYTYSDFLKFQPLNFKGTKGVVKTVGHDATYGMPWKTLKKMMTDKYCLRGKIKKLEIELWNMKPFKRQNVARAYIVGLGEKKVYEGLKPLCSKCNYHHDGQCAPRCNNCKKVGHLARDCRSTAATANNQRALGANQRAVTCFECGAQVHFKRDCPKLKNNNRGNQARNGGATTRAYAVGNAGKTKMPMSLRVRSSLTTAMLLSCLILVAIRVLCLLHLVP
ncbi:putative reverse transcriptase domain-containing protein [Tanacetum coccineum]